MRALLGVIASGLEADPMHMMATTIMETNNIIFI